MNLDEFSIAYEHFGIKQIIDIKCDQCNKDCTLYKEKVRDGIRKHGCFLCRSCCMKKHYDTNPRSEQTNKKISRAKQGIALSDQTKQRMSKAKSDFYKTSAGIEARKMLSKLTAEGHAQNKFENSKRQGWYPSSKNDEWIFYGSSYELLLCYQLEHDNSVESYSTQIGYSWDGRSRCLDFLVTYIGSVRQKAIEVKPESRLSEEVVQSQISDSKSHAFSQGWDFEVYTEMNLGMSYVKIREWADKMRETITGINYTEHRQKSDRKKAKRHYNTKIATDTVTVYCEFCKAEHTALRLTHDKNIARNGRYICEREGGFIAGSKPKKKKVNSYAAEGKKQCTACNAVKLMTEFGTDKGRSDGLSNKCKVCRATEATAKYQAKKGQ